MLESQTTTLSFFEDEEAVLKTYLQYGFHIEENIYSDIECEQMIAAAHKLENASNKSFRPQMMPHRSNSIFLNAFKKPALKTIMNKLVGGEAFGLQTEFFYCKPGTRGFSLHQDNFFVQAPVGVFASAWIALTDTYPEKGGLIVYPGTHHEGLLPVTKLTLSVDNAQDPNANNEETIVPSNYKPFHPCVPKGAALFIHGHLVHGSNANQTNEWRYVLLNTYIRKGENFRPGNYAKREAIPL